MSKVNQVELVEVEDGKVIVREVQGDGTPLMTMEFNPMVEQLFGDRKIDICRQMLSAGLESAAQINQSHFDFWLSQRPVQTQDPDRDLLLEYFAQEHPREIDEHLTFH